MPVFAGNDIQVEIKSIDSLAKKYDTPEKIQLHLDLAKLYAKNSKWWQYYKHLRDIYIACPDLNMAKIIMVNDDNDYEFNKNTVPIDPYIIKRLKELGVNGLLTQDQAIDYIDLLKPICDLKCKKINKNNILKEE